MEQDHYTLTYRAAEARQVMNWVKAGQFDRLIGLRGAGKSSFLYFLIHKDIRRHYLGANCADFLFVPALFRCLRTIHYAHEGNVSYTIVVANHLAYLPDDLAGRNRPSAADVYSFLRKRTGLLGSLLQLTTSPENGTSRQQVQ